eukprot:scaffold148_cov78-Phaeocystis_antarctica.AAC.21
MAAMLYSGLPDPDRPFSRRKSTWCSGQPALQRAPTRLVASACSGAFFSSRHPLAYGFLPLFIRRWWIACSAATFE